jgi:predicted O-methyltransferase YrrM
LLFRLVNFQQSATVLEIGTSFGLTTAYLAAANQQARVITLEGCPATAQIAQGNFKQLKLKNISLITGNFEETLPALLSTTDQLDFVFFDGNHQYEPTLRYFEWCLAKRTAESIFVLDDIYWSKEMTRAWRAICARPEVMISIDLFYFGLVFFRDKQPKQHFTIKL